MLSRETETHRYYSENCIPAKSSNQTEKTVRKGGLFCPQHLLRHYTLWGYNTLCMKAEIKNSITNRLRRVEGQVRGLQKMVDEEKYCVDIITQSSAVRSALSAVEDLMLENHLSEHVIHQMKQGQEKKAVGEIISIFKKAKKK